MRLAHKTAVAVVDRRTNTIGRPEVKPRPGRYPILRNPLNMGSLFVGRDVRTGNKTGMRRLELGPFPTNGSRRTT